MHKGAIHYFLACLERHEPEAIESYNHELDPKILYKLHKVNDVETYLQRMQLSTKPTTTDTKIGLWGDALCIHWLSKWVNIQISIYSLMKGKKYLHFNKYLNTESCSLLFHDLNPLSEQFEPLMQFTTDLVRQKVHCLPQDINETMDLKSNTQDATIKIQRNSQNIHQNKTQITMAQKRKQNEHASLHQLKKKIRGNYEPNPLTLCAKIE